MQKIKINKKILIFQIKDRDLSTTLLKSKSLIHNPQICTRPPFVFESFFCSAKLPSQIQFHHTFLPPHSSVSSLIYNYRGYRIL